MNQDLFQALSERVDALERTNRRMRLMATATTGVAFALVALMVGIPLRADAQRAPGPLIAEGGIYLTKNGAVRAQLAVDTNDRVQLILFGSQRGGNTGPSAPPPLGDLLQQAGVAAINGDSVLVLTSTILGSSINLAGGAAKSNIVMATNDLAGPSMLMYGNSQLPLVQVLGLARGQASVGVNGHFATIDDISKETWRAPVADIP